MQTKQNKRNTYTYKKKHTNNSNMKTKTQIKQQNYLKKTNKHIININKQMTKQNMKINK